MFQAIDDFLIDRVFMPCAKFSNRLLGVSSTFLAATSIGCATLFAVKLLGFQSESLWPTVQIVWGGGLTLLLFGLSLLEEKTGVLRETRKDLSFFLLRCFSLIIFLLGLPPTIAQFLFWDLEIWENPVHVEVFEFLKQLLGVACWYFLACKLPPKKKEKKLKFATNSA